MCFCNLNVNFSVGPCADRSVIRYYEIIRCIRCKESQQYVQFYYSTVKKKKKGVKTFSFLSDTAGRSLLTALYLRS